MLSFPMLSYQSCVYLSGLMAKVMLSGTCSVHMCFITWLHGNWWPVIQRFPMWTIMCSLCLNQRWPKNSTKQIYRVESSWTLMQNTYSHSVRESAGRQNIPRYTINGVMDWQHYSEIFFRESFINTSHILSMSVFQMKQNMWKVNGKHHI